MFCCYPRRDDAKRRDIRKRLPRCKPLILKPFHEIICCHWKSGCKKRSMLDLVVDTTSFLQSILCASLTKDAEYMHSTTLSCPCLAASIKRRDASCRGKSKVANAQHMFERPWGPNSPTHRVQNPLSCRHDLMISPTGQLTQTTKRVLKFINHPTT